MNQLLCLIHFAYFGAILAISDTYVHKGSLDTEKYLSLPHTVFSPQGRLYNVERNAVSTSDPDDLSSSLVIAIKFGVNGSILVLSTKSFSPHLHDRKIGKKGEDVAVVTELWTHENSPITSPSPCMILPSNIIIGTGGSAADSLALRSAIHDIALSFYKANDSMRSTHQIEGAVSSSILAKKVADHLQLPTQNAAKNRQLSSAAIVAGLDGDDLSIFRCDSTGQFWECHAAAVGRGAGDAEVTLMRRVKKWMNNHDCGSGGKIQIGDLISAISSQDVQQYLSSLSFDETVALACKCLVEAFGLSRVESMTKNGGLRGILVRKDGQSLEGKSEYIRNEILHKALQKVLCDD